MGNTRGCMEQAVLFIFYESAYSCTGRRGEDSHAGNQSGKFIEDVPGKA